jgi:16S rRNA G527 N7-methylase RsmG
MITIRHALDLDVNDDEFNLVYPEKIREIAQTQWTPVEVAKLAAKFLAEKPGTKVLDIGSGTGKFCIIGAAYTMGEFTGVEQRLNLVQLSQKISSRYGLNNANYIHSNITEIHFAEYDAFYFFNAFYENIDMAAVIDDTVERGINYYKLYTRYVSGQLSKMPAGTRLATYWSPVEEIPNSYQLRFSAFDENLKCWEKIR